MEQTRKVKRILFTMTPAFNPNGGGVQRTTFKLGKYFTEAGIQVAYFSMNHTGHVDSEYGQVFHSEHPGSHKESRNLKHLHDTVLDFSPDVVINQMPYVDSMRIELVKAKKQQDFLLLGCLRNSLFNFKNNISDRIDEMVPRIIAPVLKTKLGKTLVLKRHVKSHKKDLENIITDHDFFILLAPPNRDELNYFVGEFKQEKVVSIPNSIPAVAQNLPAKEKVILHVGRLNVRQKRSDLLLPFWQALAPQLPDWKFIVVGDGEYGETLRKEVLASGVERMELMGHQKPEAYYSRAPIFMMPSAYEGFPNTLLEAQSFGAVPFAFNSYAAVKWIVSDGKNAELIEPFDIEKMANRIALLAKNDSTRKTMAAEALKNAEQFTIEKVGALWLKFFEENL